MAEKEIIAIELTEESIESMVYEIRNQKVMLDFDLAKIYGYTTKRFNEQVKRNIEKFPEDFMFQLTEAELRHLLRSQFATTEKSTNESEDLLRSQFATTIISGAGSEKISRSNFLTTMQTKGIRGGRAYLPYAFTEQGVYMLMTVLRGELAVKQSKALIRLFKKMKDYIVESNNLLTTRDILELSNQVHKNAKSIESLKRKDAVMDKKLTRVMDYFIDPNAHKHFSMKDGQMIEADVAYQTIYSLAKSTIHIIDDYIDLKTLHLLLVTDRNVKITIVSDNASRNPLQTENIEEFKKETGINLIVKPSNNRCHDRFVFIDYHTDKEKVYLCGSSSKDAGKRATTITKIEQEYINHDFFDEILTF